MTAEIPVPRVTHLATIRVPTRYADFVAHAYRDERTGHEHLVLALGDLGDAAAGPPWVELHQECPVPDDPGSPCDCADRLDAAQAAIAAEGRGAVVHLRGSGGQGVGALAVGTATGPHQAPPDYAAAAAMLLDLGAYDVRLLSSDPATESGLARSGLRVSGRGQRVADGWAALLAGRVPAGGQLAARYGPLVAAGPRLVLAQLGQSLDGFIAARTGDARFVTGPADRAHLHRLRALVDAVVVGVGTVLADDCQLTVRAVAGPHPVRVVLDPDGRAPREAHVLTSPDAPTLWVVADDRPVPTGQAPHVRLLPLPRAGDDGGFAPAQVLSALAARGLGRVLVEGGGVTVSRFLAAGALDRLLLTTAPLLVGDGVPGLRFEGQDRLADALRAPSRRFVLGEDLCIELDLARAARDRSGEPGDGEGEEPR